MSEITKPILLDETGQSLVLAVNALERRLAGNNVTTSETQVFPAEAIFNDTSNGATVTSCTSLNRYLMSETANITAFDFKLTNGNIYESSNWIRIEADANNFLSFSVGAYVANFKLMLNGTLNKNISYSSSTGTFWNELATARASWTVFDFILKQIRVCAKLYNGTIKTCLSQDISTWDLSNLKEFNIITTVSNFYSGKVSVKNVRINNAIAPEYLANSSLTVGNFIGVDTVTPMSNGGSIDGDDISLTLGGTIQETIDAKHKITLANNASYTYFACGANSSKYSGKRQIFSIFKAKFTNMSDTFKIGPSGPCRNIWVIDPDTGTTVADWHNRLGGNTYGESLSHGWKPTADKWYLFYQNCDNTLSYTSSYSWYLNGSATIEAIAIACCYDTAMNLCAQNYNGVYFTGNIPFLTGNVPAFIVPNWTSMNYPPTKAVGIDANGNISMFNGTAWKQLNNA